MNAEQRRFDLIRVQQRVSAAGQSDKFCKKCRKHTAHKEIK